MHVRSLLVVGAVLAAIGVQLTAINRADARPDGDEAAKHDPKLLGYGVGYYLGHEVREGVELDQVEVDMDHIIKGFADGLRAADPKFDEEELEEVLAAVHVRMQRKTVERLLAEDEAFRKLHDENLARSLAYLEENAKKEGVIVRDSGVQYKVIVKGDGPTPGLGDTVVANFQGRLVDGPEFARGEGIELEVNDLLPGTRELVTSMPVGSTWEVAVPPDLAYGPGGGPPNIGPNEALIGTIEILGIK